MAKRFIETVVIGILGGAALYLAGQLLKAAGVGGAEGELADEMSRAGEAAK